MGFSDQKLMNTGPIVRIAPHQYSINDASSIKVIYGHGSSFLKVSSPVQCYFVVQLVIVS